MTTLVSWIGVDSRSPSSVYIASDSRISWGPHQVWDHGRKVFASSRYPDIWGYCGDVLFPSLVMGQIVDSIDALAILEANDVADRKHNKVVTALKMAFATYPASEKRSFSILHCSRNCEGMESEFFAWETSWNPTDGWVDSPVHIPTESGMLVARGSGGEQFNKWNFELKRSEIGGTSRAVFQAITIGLTSAQDPLSGGPPQLVGLYRKGAGKSFGIVWNNECWIHGMRVVPGIVTQDLEVRNELFERCSCETKQILPGAQPQPGPLKQLSL
jgi:hypothetical protein